jgi:hypothetical protein
VGKRAQSGLDSGLDVFLPTFLVNRDHFRRLGGIDGTDLARGLDALAADDQVILAAQLATHFADGGAHLAHVVFFAEIDKRLILKRTFMKANLQTGWGFHGSHRRSFLGDRGIEKEYFTPAGSSAFRDRVSGLRKIKARIFLRQAELAVMFTG